MFPVLSKAAVSILVGAATLTNPATPDSLPFGASAYVTVNNQIRVSVQKNPDIPVVILLRNKDNQVLFRQHVSKRDTKYAVKLDVEELADGQYELEVKSSEGSIRKQLNVATAPVRQTTRVIAMQ